MMDIDTTRLLRNCNYARFDAQDALQKLGDMLAYLDKYSAWYGAPNVKRSLHALRERSDAALQKYERAYRELNWIYKYNPNQPRVPAGNSDGGQWTDGGGSGSSVISGERQNFQNYLRGKPIASQPSIVQDTEDNPFRNRDDEIVNAQYTPRGPRSAMGFPNASPAQQARHALAYTRSMEDLRLVREVDPNWRPAQNLRSTNSTIDTEIAIAESISIQARARLMELSSSPMRNAQTLGDLFMPNGRFVRERSASNKYIRTLPPDVFQSLGSYSLLRSQPTAAPQTYRGQAFERSDGSIVGLRDSPRSGLTIDVIRSQNSLIPEGFKVHQK